MSGVIKQLRFFPEVRHCFTSLGTDFLHKTACPLQSAIVLLHPFLYGYPLSCLTALFGNSNVVLNRIKESRHPVLFLILGRTIQSFSINFYLFIDSHYLMHYSFLYFFVSLIIVSFSSLNILIMATLKFLSVNSNIWPLSQAGSVACLFFSFFLVHGSYFSVSFHV